MAEVIVSGRPVGDVKDDDKEPDKWEIDCWVDTIVRAEEIKGDKNKMKYVMPKLQERQKGMKDAINSIDKLRNKAKAMAEAEGE